MTAIEGRPGRLHDWIASALAREIAAGEPAPGELLPSETDLCARFAASRTAVREALKVLEAKGLIGIEHGRGSRVRALAEWNIFDPLVIGALRDSPVIAGLLGDLVRVREAVEVEAAAMAADAAEPGDVAALRDSVEGMASVLDDAPAYFALDVRFHELLFAATGNVVLVRLVEPVKALLHAARRHVVEVMSEDSLRRSMDGHARITAAVEAGDPIAAREAMAAHLRQTREELQLAADARVSRGRPYTARATMPSRRRARSRPSP